MLTDLSDTIVRLLGSPALPLGERLAMGALVASPLLLVALLAVHRLLRAPHRRAWEAVAATEGWRAPEEGQLAGDADGIAWEWEVEDGDAPTARAFVARGFDPTLNFSVDLRGGQFRLARPGRTNHPEQAARDVRIALALVGALRAAGAHTTARPSSPPSPVTRLPLLLALCAAPLAPLSGQTTPSIPLCPGLTVTTAVRQLQGDYESLKSVLAVSATQVRLRYSMERLTMDMFDDKPRLLRTVVQRELPRADLDTASLYLQQYGEFTPPLVPGTTAIGTSAAVLRALKGGGAVTMGIFLPVLSRVSAVPGDHPSVYDHQMVAPVRRIGPTVRLRVLVDDAPAELPAIRVGGDFFGDSVEFLFLDDPANPLTLQYRFGIGGVTQADVDMANPLLGKPRAGDDKDTFRVVRIGTRCQGPPVASAPGGGAAPPDPLEAALATHGRADVHQVHFAFNSDTVREESLPTIARIAALMTRHPDWTLQVNGHTDNVASDSYNLALSRRRAAAVRRLLVSRHGIAESRLRSDGYGESQPREGNDTLEGRARNRRVELVRVSP